MLKQKTQTTLPLQSLGSTAFNTLCGPHNQNIKLLEHQCQVLIKCRDQSFTVEGDQARINKACRIIKAMTEHVNQHASLAPAQVSQLICQHDHHATTETLIRCQHFSIKAMNKNQIKTIKNIQQYDINFAIGPAGTGKTFLAVACALQALEHGTISKIILTRPIVEAGEKLGFLPGDINQKVDPYLRPLYDALQQMIGPQSTQKLIENGVIEITPLAYMRGRTFNHAFIIIDESQNTTREQMKMMLTRLGSRSKLVATGDITQIDLQRKHDSGLVHATEVLSGLHGIKVNCLSARDTLRHLLVKRIIKAYERYEQ